MTREHNPPAFATPPIYNPNTGDYIHGQPGMDLRDLFAGMALQGIVANPEAGGSIEEIAHYSYRYADAMLAERAKGGES